MRNDLTVITDEAASHDVQDAETPMQKTPDMKRPLIQRATAVLAVALALCFVHGDARAQQFTDASSRLVGGIPLTFRVLGAAAVDIDGDDYVDLYQRGHLYMSRQGATFENAIDASGLDEGDIPFGAIFGDYTNDGYPDVFFEDLTPPSNVFRSVQPGQFEQTNNSSGINTLGLPVQGSLWLDYDNDGKLDLFVGGDGEQDRLFKNADYNVFLDMSLLVRLPVARQNYGAAAGDLNRDGRVDFYIAACSVDLDKSRNALWLNLATGLTQVTAGVEDTRDSWGTLFFDYDNDGWLDIYVVNSSHNDGRSGMNRLYRYNGPASFVDVAVDAGVAGEDDENGYTAAAADFDNDGWIDLYVLNIQGDPNHLYRNNGDGTFTDVWDDSKTPDEVGAIAVADVNNDGWIDIFFGTDSGGGLFLNDGGANHWLKVGLRGSASNYFGVGARVEVYEGGSQQVREITAGDGMTSQSHNFTAHFGLGTAPSADSVVVRWPSGIVDRFENVIADKHIRVAEGSAFTIVGVETMKPSVPVAHAIAFPNPFSDYVTIRLDGQSGSNVEILDITGRKVQSVAVDAAGEATWFGDTVAGAPAAPGVYLLRTADLGVMWLGMVVKR